MKVGLVSMERPETPNYARYDERVGSSNAAMHTHQDATSLWTVVWNWKGSILLGGLVAAVVTFFVLLQLTPVYRAKTHVLVGSGTSLASSVPNLVQERPATAAMSESVVIVMKSNDILRAVIQELDLQENSDYNRTLRQPSVADHVKKWARSILKSVSAASEGKSSDLDKFADPADPLAGTLRGLRSSVSTRVLGESFIVEIAAESSNPKVAAEIADTIAKEFLERQLEVNLQAGETATKWLEGRVAELKENVAAEEQRVAEFRNQLIYSGENSTDDLRLQLAELNAQLARLSSERSVLIARQQEITLLFIENNYVALAEVLELPGVSELLAQLSKLDRSIVDLKAKYGDHQGVAKVVKERDQVANQLDEQIDQSLSGLNVRIEVVTDQIETLESEVQTARTELADQRQDELTLLELQREAETSRDAYNRFLLRLKEAREQSLFQPPEASIVSYAAVPLNPVAPQKVKMSAVAAIAGGAMVLVLIAFFGDSQPLIRNPQDVAQLTGVTSVQQIPLVRGVTSSIDLLKQARDSSDPQILQSINWLRIRLMQEDSSGVTVIMVTSTAPGEGKSALSLLLAEAFEMNGYTTLLVNADPASGGLSDASVSEEFQKSPFKYFDYSEEAIRSLETQGGFANALKKRQREMRQTDVIIVDGPVALSSPEFIEFGKLADHVVMACEWNKTKNWDLKQSIDVATAEGLVVSAVVINKVPPKAMLKHPIPVSTPRKPLFLPPPSSA